MGEKWFLAALFFALLVTATFSGGLLTRSGDEPQKPSDVSGDSVVYLAYSETCPHCHTLIEYVQSSAANVTLAATKEGAVLQPVLREHNVSWDFGVPLMFAVADGQLIGLKGFPTESQEQDGYFINRDFEQQLCQQRGGQAHTDGSGEYIFCELPNGLFLGNHHSADYIISTCESSSCEAIDVHS